MGHIREKKMRSMNGFTCEKRYVSTLRRRFFDWKYTGIDGKVHKGTDASLREARASAWRIKEADEDK